MIALAVVGVDVKLVDVVPRFVRFIPTWHLWNIKIFIRTVIHAIFLNLLVGSSS